jgi:hypothetical protein
MTVNDAFRRPDTPLSWERMTVMEPKAASKRKNLAVVAARY